MRYALSCSGDQLGYELLAVAVMGDGSGGQGPGTLARGGGVVINDEASDGKAGGGALGLRHLQHRLARWAFSPAAGELVLGPEFLAAIETVEVDHGLGSNATK